MAADIAAMLDGAGILAAGLVLGRFWPARRRGAKLPKPVCGCGHDLAHHEPDGSGGGTTCHSLMYVPTTMSCDSHHVPCTCRQYSGPRIMDPGYVAREITDGT